MNMPLVLLNRRRRGGPAAFSPTRLFALAEPGVWYDPSDLTTLFTDTAGTTPVTTPGQTVALALDKSKGLVLGSELVTNGDFSGGSTGWTVGTNWSVSGGSASHAAGAAGELSQLLTIQSGMGYRVTFTISNLTGGSGYIQFAAGGFQNIFGFTTNGTYTVTVNSNAAYTRVGVVALSAASFTIDNISVRELPGFHATQATAASRPTYGIVPATGRRNLLTFTEQFDNAAWVKTLTTVTANAAVAPDGTTTAELATPSGIPNNSYALQNSSVQTGTLSFYAKEGAARYFIVVRGAYTAGDYAVFDLQSGAITQTPTFAGSTASIVSIGSGWYRCILTSSQSTAINAFSVSGAPTGLSTSAPGGLFIWGAQLETGSTATAYQRVGSAFDVTEAGVASLSYLSFDGVDDFLVTPTITPGIDKAQVFAGVRKLSDAATGVVAEFSADSTTNNGSIGLFAPAGTVGLDAQRISGFVRGTAVEFYRPASAYAAPTTRVATLLADIAGSRSLRLDGVAVDTRTTVQSSNFLAYPLYIGRRGGTSLAFNGQLYSLIVRFGANLDANTITNTETWVNSKTGAY